jgi:hypothetical protein
LPGSLFARRKDEPAAGPGASLLAGLATLALVAACSALAWADDSPVAAQAGGTLEGDAGWAWAFLACGAGAVLAYLAGLVGLRRAGASRRAVVAVALAIQLAPLGAPLLLSTDAWTYWAYARIAAIHGGDPYAESPQDYPDDAAFRWAGADWRDSGSVYGPAFTIASEAVAPLENEDAAAWAFKVAAAAALVACVLLAAARGAFAAAFVGWNPVLALHFAGGGHNDAWMAALVLAALALAASSRRQLAGAAWAAAVLVKWVPLLFLPLRALEARRSGRKVGHAGFALTAAAVLALATLQFGLSWLDAFGPLAGNAGGGTGYALPSRLEDLGLPRAVAVAALGLAFAAAYAWLLREAWRGRARLGLAAGLALLATPYLAPWYLVWAVPLAAVEDDRPGRLLALGLTAYLLPQTIPV